MKTRVYYQAKPGARLNPSQDGNRMLALKVGESMVIPWQRCPIGRPKGPAEMGLGGKVFWAEPLEEGLKITRQA